MSKEMTEAELFTHCQNSVKELSTTLSAFSKISECKKRAMLIAYWIKTYLYYIRNEDRFNPNSVFRLKRGSIVRVEFGYRVGRELGGRHYAVVLDEKNSMYWNTVTVIPLGSIKESKKETRYTIPLEDGIFKPVYAKLTALISETNSVIDEATKLQEKIDSALPNEANALRGIQRSKIKNARSMQDKALEWCDEIMHMKQGSVANVGQITTISKMRISQPLQKTHPLYGVRLSAGDMDRIDGCIKALFFPQKHDT